MARARKAWVAAWISIAGCATAAPLDPRDPVSTDPARVERAARSGVTVVVLASDSPWRSGDLEVRLVETEVHRTPCLPGATCVSPPVSRRAVIEVVRREASERVTLGLGIAKSVGPYAVRATDIQASPPSVSLEIEERLATAP